VDGRDNPDRATEAGERAELTRHEETLNVATEWVDDDRVRIRKSIETVPVTEDVNRSIVFMDTEHVPAADEDDGQVHELEDGTLSIPVLEEQIVVTRRTVVRERLLVHRHIESERVTIEDEVRREHVEVELEDGRPVELHRRGYTAPFPNSSADPRRNTG
jgi:uncharacterized protein (TIGR02271 family)